MMGELMTSVYSWAYADDLLYKVLSRMTKKKIYLMILGDENEDPVGIFLFKDLFRFAL
jgi:signal-transduction protein with cAMP-binding, CBS, and nucleotidyltransferase domain